MQNKPSIIKSIYLSVTSAIGLVVMIIGLIGASNLLLESFLFPVEDRYYFNRCEEPNNKESDLSKEECLELEENRYEMQQRSQFNRAISGSLSAISIGLPVWLFHFLLLLKDWKQKK